MMRRLLAVLFLTALACGVSAWAEDKVKKDRNESGLKGDPSILVTDSLTRETQLRRSFELFRQKLAIMANRLENGSDKDKEKAKALRKALKMASEQGTEGKFDSLIRSLSSKGADKNLDILSQVVRENGELRKDLKKLIALLSRDETASNREQIEKTARLLEQLKELIAKQERVRAQTEIGRKNNKELEKDQNKVTRETKEVADGRKGERPDKGESKGEAKPDSKSGAEGKAEAKNDVKTKADNKPGESKNNEGKNNENKEGKTGENKEGSKETKTGEPKGTDGKESKAGEAKEGKGADGKPSQENKPGEGKKGESKEGKAGENKEGKPGEGKAGEGKPGDAKSGEGKPGENKEGKPGEGKPGQGKESKPSDKAGFGKAGEAKDGKPSDGKGGKPGEAKTQPGAKPSGSKSGEAKPGSKSGEGKPGEGKPSAGKPGEKKGGAGKPSAGKPGQGKPGESKGQGQGKGEAKPGKPSEGKPGSSGGKPGQGKPSSGKSGQPKPGQGKPSGSPPPGNQDDQNNDNPVKKQIEDANKYQKQAEIDLDKAKRDGAVDNQTKAIKELEAAKKKLEDLLRQMREEEMERLLADLEKRCRYMLQMQIEVRDETVVLDRDITKEPEQKPTLTQTARVNKQADKEEEILREAAMALKLIQTEGSAVAFAEVFEQVSKDMENVANRLKRVNVDKVTQTIENDIIDTLKEMIAALQKAQKDVKNQGKPSKGGGQPPPQALIDQLAELKMIYAMQRRVNARTEMYGKQYKGEQAPPPSSAPTEKEKKHYEMIQNELKDLSNRQEKIGKVTKDIATGKNEAK
jgi:hypothetical protein